jgi:hypothetical protein
VYLFLSRIRRSIHMAINKKVVFSYPSFTGAISGS